MRDSLLIILCFAIGLLLGFVDLLPNKLLHTDISTYVLYVLMFVVGVGIGSDKESLAVLRKANWKIFLVPLAVVVGSIGASMGFAMLTSDLSMREAAAVASGFGYYSLSSILITKMHSESLGTIALLANVIRELLTLLLAPWMAIVFGKLAPIAAGGATAMDTTLPIITRASGNEYGIIAVFSGVVLTVLVPFIVTFILTF